MSRCCNLQREMRFHSIRGPRPPSHITTETHSDGGCVVCRGTNKRSLTTLCFICPSRMPPCPSSQPNHCPSLYCHLFLPFSLSPLFLFSPILHCSSICSHSSIFHPASEGRGRYWHAPAVDSTKCVWSWARLCMETSLNFFCSPPFQSCVFWHRHNNCLGCK